MSRPTVVVGLSGGVDSSLSAFLLKEQGYDVIGLFMKNWEENDGNGLCLSSQDFDDVQRVSAHLRIPYYSVNFVQEYREKVFAQFLADCKAGLTPNPDILCNREIKFNLLLKKARELGATFLATGHYCRTKVEGNQSLLLKGLDPGKDQSYFLHAIDPAALQQTLFPVGHLHKSEVRRLAREANLPTSEKKDSTGICFIGERNFKQFLGQYLGFQPGPLLTLDGTVVGTHDGFAYYTLGQRRGIGLGGEGDAWYVVGKDPQRNAVMVERGERHPALYCDWLSAKELTWLSTPKESCSAKIRYRQADTPCKVTFSEGGALVEFSHPQRAVTPGQSVVFYDGEICLGGGLIDRAGPSYYEMAKTL